MKTLMFAAAMMLTLAGLATITAPNASATVCVFEDPEPAYCVCVVNAPPGQGCGPRGTGCFVGVKGAQGSDETGIVCVE